MRALLLSPAPRLAFYFGKLAVILILMLLVEAVVLLLSAILFGFPIGAHPGLVAGLFGLGTLGYGAVGALFALLLGRARSRDVLLAVMLYPIIIPVMIAGSRGTAALLEEVPDLQAARFWIRFLLVFDVIFLVAATWVFEPLLEERA